MSHAEALGWTAYIRKRGGLNPNLRMELGFAMIAKLIDQKTGGHAPLQTFIPSLGVEEEDEGDATIEDVMGILRGAIRSGK